MAVHLALLEADVILLEGIRLSEVPEGVYFLSAAPLNLSGADGSPCRAILIDGDRVSESNINRQLIADITTIGKWKAEAAAERVRKINPDCTVTAVNEFADSSNVDRILTEANADYVVDAIDCVTTKLLIALWAQEHNVPVISSMGTGNKLDPSKFVVTDISKTSVCPLARVMRRECKAKGIRKLTVLYSTEEPVKTGLRVPASISYVPSCAGLMIAGHVIRSIINE
jgi:tRNA A37 threonylcarbamoyladenosine dehydratase